MQIALEDFVPFDQSLQWRIHDAYYASRGIAAWKEGALPYFGTGNYPAVRRDARLIVEVAEELVRAGRLGPEEEIFVLEIGGGLGQFAYNFFRALREGCGKAGREIGARARFVFSDYSLASLQEAVGTSALEGLVRSGKLIAAQFDLRRPGELRDLEGRPMRPSFAAIVANYVCCAAPTKMFRKTQGGYEEKHVRFGLEAEKEVAPGPLLEACLKEPTKPDLLKSLEACAEWRPVDLEAVLPHPLHAQAIRAATEGFAEATLAYPLVFLEALRALERMAPGGMVLINDFGSILRENLKGLKDLEPTLYGNTLSCAVSFPVIEAFCRKAGWDMSLSDSPFSDVHTAAIRFMPEAPRSFREAFRKANAQKKKGEEMTDFACSGAEALEKKDYMRAIRQFMRCLRLDPESPQSINKHVTFSGIRPAQGPGTGKVPAGAHAGSRLC